MFQFQYIENLYALAAIPFFGLLFFLLIRWKKNASKKIGDPVLVKQLMKDFSAPKFATKFILIVIAFALCAFAVAGLVIATGTQKISKNGIDVMIALDVSNSMLADDIKPNRLERAKQVISKIIDKLSDDRIGIVIFAGKAYLQMPMTTDHSAAKMYLSSASPDDVPTQGTDISQALKMCYAAFNTKEKKYRSILLITDGEDHDEDAIKVTKQLAEEGIMINTVGIGSPQGSPIHDPKTNDYKKDEAGNTVISKLDEDELKKIAENGKGLYQLFTSADEVAGNIKQQLSGIGQTTLSDTSMINYENYYWYFLIAAFILLVTEFFISERKKVKETKFIKAISVIFVFLLLNNFSFAQQVNKEIKNGNKSYKNNNYGGAAESYQKALQISPENPFASYNLGNTLYKANRAEDAVKFYDNSIKSAPDYTTKQKGYYNKGVAYQKQNKLPECIRAYKNALKIDPKDEDARQNLERALKQQKQQQKQDDKKDKKQDEDKKDDKKKQDQEKNDPKPQPSKISKQDAEEKLKSLLEHEKDLQEKLKKVRVASPDRPAKDW
jgi:Ca-activated chloride channel family protein